jgi:hypothetical protein
MDLFCSVDMLNFLFIMNSERELLNCMVGHIRAPDYKEAEGKEYIDKDE